MPKSEDKAARRLEKAQRKLEKAKRKLAEAEARRTAKAQQIEAETAAAEIEAEATRIEAEAAEIEGTAADKDMAEDKDMTPRAAGRLVVAEGGNNTSFTISPEVAERLKSAGKGWQKKAEAAMALWLDEASVVIRKDGLDGLSENMKGKADFVKARARDGKTEEKVEKLVKTAMSTVGRDIAQAALGAAFAAFGEPNARRSPDDADTADAKPEAQAAPEKAKPTKKPAKPAPSRRRKPARRAAAAKRKPKAE